MSSLARERDRTVRVLKCHTDAVEHVLTTATTSDRKELVKEIADAVIHATDGSKTYFVVLTQEDDGCVYSWGPYATFSAAERASKSGLTSTGKPYKAMIKALYPTPRKGL
jgi:hypothetical protein